MIRGAEAISTVFPDLKHMLLQSAKNAIIPLPSDVADKVKLQRNLVDRVLPGMPEDVHYAIDQLIFDKRCTPVECSATGSTLVLP